MIINFTDVKERASRAKPAILSRMDTLADNASFILGPDITRFEERLASTCGFSKSVGVASGTAGLYLLFSAYREKGITSVVLPGMTFIATALAALNAGLKIYVQDVDIYGRGEFDIRGIDNTICVPVYLYGLASYNFKGKGNVIIDGSQAIGVEEWGTNTAVLSFYPSKSLGAWGDAGAVLTNDKEIYSTVSSLRDYGRVQGDRYRAHVQGDNLRLDTMQAVVLDVMLDHFKDDMFRRRQVATRYWEVLEDIKSVRCIVPSSLKEYYAPYVFPIEVQSRQIRADLVTFLEDRGIQTGYYYPLTLQDHPVLQNRGDVIFSSTLVNSSRLADRAICIPMHAFLEEEHIHWVLNSIKSFVSTSLG